MAKDGGGSPHHLIIQSWVMYSIAIIIFIVRLYARFKRLGLHYQIEDYLMTGAVCFYTAFVVTNIKIVEIGGSTLYKPGELASFSEEEIKARIKGAKFEFGSENCLLCTLYMLKACMLLVYFRITSNLKQHRFVKICAIYTFLGWLTTELTLIFNCHPLTGYWTIPPPQHECSTYFRYEVVQCVFNISSDIAILLVILPMLFRMRMPWRTKVPVIVGFSMGIAVIFCAIVSKYFTFRDIYDDSYQFWYLREASAGIYVTNAPFVWTLAQPMISFLRSTTSPTNDKQNNKYQYGTGGMSIPLGQGGTETKSIHPLTAAQDTHIAMNSPDNIIELDDLERNPYPPVVPLSWSERAQGQLPRSSSNSDLSNVWKTTKIVIEKH